ncbi:hypothetical protein ILUMI_23461 [Ignelater luminosus]|uniref:Cation-dependent mannose-6-phosphate receptor n=1 Tax=Ignelater luminosus TaxID=2038154 RepID=A0A8K0C8S8_IGNLU|nr:hypothetical protein ILUMI_23461 [Ignelater luminosus]
MAERIFKDSFLSILLCVLFSYSIHSEDNACVVETACLCQLNDERIIDISHVTKDEPLSVSKENLTYLFYPCSNYKYDEAHIKKLKLDVNVTLNFCNKDGASLCLYNATDKSLTNLGDAKDAKFSGNLLKSLVYSRPKSNITSLIKLDCTPDDTNSYLTLEKNQSSDTHHLILFSRYACAHLEQHGLSTGSTLLIMFCVGFGIYLIGGALVLHYLRGAQGKEMIPNFDFWVDLPYLVRDGTVFLLSGCNPLSVARAETYDRI